MILVFSVNVTLCVYLLYLISRCKQIGSPFYFSYGCHLTCLTIKLKTAQLRLIVFTADWPCYRSESCLGWMIQLYEKCQECAEFRYLLHSSEHYSSRNMLLPSVQRQILFWYRLLRLIWSLTVIWYSTVKKKVNGTSKPKTKDSADKRATKIQKMRIREQQIDKMGGTLHLKRVCSQLWIAELNRMSLHSLTIKCYSILFNCSICHLFSRLSQCVTFPAPWRVPEHKMEHLKEGKVKCSEDKCQDDLIWIWMWTCGNVNTKWGLIPQNTFY